jgi:hypothetical protein
VTVTVPVPVHVPGSVSVLMRVLACVPEFEVVVVVSVFAPGLGLGTLCRDLVVGRSRLGSRGTSGELVWRRELDVVI